MRPRSAAAPIARAGLGEHVSKRREDSRQKGKSLRDGCEHALVEAEQDVGDLAAANAGVTENLHETKVGEVTDEGAALMGEGERVTPEEPLKSDDRDRHERKQDQREGRLAPGKTAVEKADSGNHEQHKGRAGHDPGKITGLYEKRVHVSSCSSRFCFGWWSQRRTW